MGTAMRMLAAVLTLAALAAAVPHWHQVPFSYDINAAKLDSDTSGWAGGTAASRLSGFFRLSRGTWTLADTFRNQLVYDIDIPGETAWAVGEQFNFPDGVVWRNAGRAWSQQADPFDRTLQAVSFPDNEHGFAGGASPVEHHPVMRYENGEWRIDSTLATNRVVLGLWATYRDKCIAVGDSGSVFHFDNGTWQQKRTLTGRHLRRVAFESNTEGWAVGDGGVILRCFKDTWALAPSPTTRNLRGLAIAATSGEAWAVGDSGTMLHMVNDSWRLDPFVPDPPYTPLYAVTFSSGGNGWAFGYNFAGPAVALHYCEDTTAVNEAPVRTRAGRLKCRPSVTARGALVHIDGSGPLEIRDCAGRLVRAWGVKREASSVQWDGRDEHGAVVPAGCYVVRGRAESSAVVVLE
jgi:photosystem II stability/assembly factor-like uncharacterized protein